ncbi:terpenoid cyclases/protein prenyltransferase alpha-alpha toroid [Mycotypha africana]|uniref:terpenoid cyclases/protein prenyltransferase alpha-alpha toroid n=1 Tax=Mycotypha africana TaxID=64632 RepID=UPI002301E2E9|nr:terpenoid cyclases/protein prenyltransferase alpha-alpha toroid [Mycotypha africana]KAI8982165.1 terpenoid cyclases/protein prenyltransferase alpha-alpha toroid [Mycotypha africana]
MGILNGNLPLASLRLKDDDLPTETSIEQKRTEDAVLEKFVPYAPHNPSKHSLDTIQLERKKHLSYLKKALKGIGSWGAALDASKPWMLYWICHSLDLLEFQFTPDLIDKAIQTLKQWQLPSGGFGGGGDQLAHLATTYAAVNAVAILGTPEAYALIDRRSLYQFLLRMKQPDGSFTMHEGGEIDIRGSYCALSAAALTHLLTPELTENCIEFIQRSQTYEGGIGPYPGKEAHNGYTFCGLAAMEIVGGVHTLDVDQLTTWCCGRQMQLEGGFQGRTNKLVDGCYSFWGAGDFPILKAELDRQQLQSEDYLLDREALQEYILLCCQSESGGLIDKPGKGPDFYHTCYCLSGLSTVQHHVQYHDVQLAVGDAKSTADGLRSLLWTSKNEYIIVGDVDNLLAATHPVHNITLRAARNIIHHFYKEEIKSIQDLLPKDEEITLYAAEE